MVFLKRFLLIFYGPLVFLFIALAPVFCGNKRGFKLWYWTKSKRAIEWLVSALSIKVVIDQASIDRLLADKGSLIVANHKSHLDVLALMTAKPNAKRITFGAKKELTRLPFFKGGFKGAGILVIDRAQGKTALQSLIQSYKDADRDLSLVLFPEGTRVTGDHIGPLKAGAVLIARETGRTILPICIYGTGDLMPRGKGTPRSGTVYVSVLEPYACDEGEPINHDVEMLHSAMSTGYADLQAASNGSTSHVIT